MYTFKLCTGLKIVSSNLSIHTAHNVVLDMKTASLGDRIVAYLLDIVIKFGYLLIVLAILRILAGTGRTAMIIFGVILAIPFVFYSLGFEAAMNGQTPGKKIMKIQVADVEGKPVTLGQYITRWLFRMIDVALFYGLPAIITIASSSRNQRIGDFTAGTVVLALRQSVFLSHTSFREVKKDHVVSYDSVILLSEAEIKVIRDTLRSKILQNNPPLVKRIADRMASKIQVDIYTDAETFLRTLLLDYNHIAQREA